MVAVWRRVGRSVARSVGQSVLEVSGGSRVWASMVPCSPVLAWCYHRATLNARKRPRVSASAGSAIAPADLSTVSPHGPPAVIMSRNPSGLPSWLSERSPKVSFGSPLGFHVCFEVLGVCSASWSPRRRRNCARPTPRDVNLMVCARFSLTGPTIV